MAAAGRRRPSTFALVGATGKGNVRRRRDGDVWGATSGGRVHLYGARVRPVLPPHRAARQDRERQARPRRRLRHSPARPTRGSLTETRVRDWQSWPARFDGSADRTINPGPLDGTEQRARHVLAACIEPDGPVDADGDQALVIDRCAPPGLPARWRGGTAVGGNRGACAAAATPPVLVAEARGPPLPCRRGLAGQRSRGPVWDRAIGSVRSHRRAARASSLRNPPSRGRHRRRLVGRAGAAWRTRIRL